MLFLLPTGYHYSSSFSPPTQIISISLSSVNLSYHIFKKVFVTPSNYVKVLLLFIPTAPCESLSVSGFHTVLELPSDLPLSLLIHELLKAKDYAFFLPTFPSVLQYDWNLFLLNYFYLMQLESLSESSFCSKYTLYVCILYFEIVSLLFLKKV